MQIVRPAAAGTMESSDVYVEVEPGTQGLQLRLESVVAQHFGQAILETVREVFLENGVENAVVRIVDRGALDCVIRARVETAISRGREEA